MDQEFSHLSFSTGTTISLQGYVGLFHTNMLRIEMYKWFGKLTVEIDVFTS